MYARNMQYLAADLLRIPDQGDGHKHKHQQAHPNRGSPYYSELFPMPSKASILNAICVAALQRKCSDCDKRRGGQDCVRDGIFHKLNLRNGLPWHYAATQAPRVNVA